VTQPGRAALATVSGATLAAVSGATRQPAAALGPRANRTIARILDATREVFLTRGYTGTTIDEIARAAGVSRASFYTYYPSKRDVLLAVGARSVGETLQWVGRLRTLEPTRDVIIDAVGEYFRLLDVHGAFAFAWTQAAQEDYEIRTAGMRTHVDLCRRMGEALATLGGVDVDDAAALGISVSSMMERAWDYCRLYQYTVERDVVEREIANIIWRTITPQ